MLISLSGKVKVIFPVVDCGLVIKCEGMSMGGGYIVHPRQLRLAGVPLLAVRSCQRCVVIRKQDGKRFKDHCSIDKASVVVL